MVDSLFGVFAPAGVQPSIQSTLNKALREVLANEETVRKLHEQGADPMPSSPEELSALFASDLKAWKAVVTAANVSIN